MNQSELTYELYRSAKILMELLGMVEEFKRAIEIFDSLGRGYAERYEKEKKDGRST